MFDGCKISGISSVLLIMHCLKGSDDCESRTQVVQATSQGAAPFR
jgi:hypothetical protein